MSSRRVHLAPTFALVQGEKEIASIEREITKVRPRVEITLEGMSEIAQGRIVEWHSARHFFTVEWTKKSEAFDAKIESSSEIRAFFKGQLFSTQLVFKSMTVRRISSTVYHFRIPEQLYQQQRRGALRVPITEQNAKLSTVLGELEVLDLSVGGAKLKLDRTLSKIRLGTTLMNCELKLGRKTIKGDSFTAKITSESEGAWGCRFSGLEGADQITIKQFLIEALRSYYQHELK